MYTSLTSEINSLQQLKHKTMAFWQNSIANDDLQTISQFM